MSRGRIVTLALGVVVALVAYSWQASLKDAHEDAEAAREKAQDIEEQLDHAKEAASDLQAAVDYMIAEMQKDHDALHRAIKNNEPRIIRVPAPEEPSSKPSPRKPGGPSSGAGGKEKPPPERRPFLRQLICLLIPFC